MPQDQKEGIGSRKGPRVGVLGGAIPAHISGFLWTRSPERQPSTASRGAAQRSISETITEVTKWK